MSTTGEYTIRGRRKPRHPGFWKKYKPSDELCVNLHFLDEVGRGVLGGCKGCRAEKDAERYALVGRKAYLARSTHRKRHRPQGVPV